MHQAIFAEVLHHAGNLPYSHIEVVTTDLRQIGNQQIWRALLKCGHENESGYFVFTLEQGAPGRMMVKPSVWLDHRAAIQLKRTDVGFYVWSGGDKRPLGLTAITKSGDFLVFKEVKGRYNLERLKEGGFNTRPLEMDKQIGDYYNIAAYCEAGNRLAIIGTEPGDDKGPLYCGVYDHLERKFLYEEAYTLGLDANRIRPKCINRFGDGYLLGGSVVNDQGGVSPWLKLVTIPMKG